MSTDGLQIRPLAEVPEHVATLAGWHHAEWGELMPDWSAAEAERELRDHATRATLPTTLVALRGGQLLGSVSVLEKDAEQFADLRPWLASLFVRPDSRTEGLGTRLVGAALALARRCGEREMYLFTAGGTAFYERLGWKPHAERELHGTPVRILRIGLLAP
jgi:predicted N-acetyltransferase YhbS